MRADTLWNKHSNQLRHFIYLRVRDKTVTDDLLHNVYLKMVSGMDRLRDRRKVKSWLYQVTRNVIIDYYRSQKNTIPLSRDVKVPSHSSRPDAWSLISECVQPFINKLPATYREALTLSDIKGFSEKQVAAKLGLSLPAAKSRIQRGRKKLKEQFDNCCIFELGPRKASIRSDTFSKEC